MPVNLCNHNSYLNFLRLILLILFFNHLFILRATDRGFIRKKMERCEMDDFDITKLFYYLAFNETKM